MTDILDENERGRILQLVQNNLSFPRIGEVQKVWTHSEAGDNSNHEVNVAIPPGGEPFQEHRRVPILQPTSGVAYVPEVGDLVRVSYLAGNGDRPVVDGAVYGDADADRAPLADEGDVRLHRKGATIEVVTTDAGDDVVRVVRQPTDGQAPDMGLELNLSTGEMKVSDGSGYGFESDGAGNIQWYAQSFDIDTSGATISW